MSTISAYTATSNAIENEYCIVEGIKSALLFADEVIVVDSYSTDNTVEQIKKIGDPRIKIFYNEWLESIGRGMYASQKNMSLGRCTSDWCVLFDSDEVFHEGDVERIRKIPGGVSDNIIAIKFNNLHFYGDYDHLMNGCGVWKDLYENRVCMIRNGLSIHHGAINSDPDGFTMNDCSPIPQDRTVHVNVNLFHYGHARSKSCYIKKQNTIERRYFPAGSKAFDPVPEDRFSFVPQERLTKFVGNHPEVMKDRISAGTDSHDKIMELYK
jgi:glycosyltransferase involved in cell wall biosynthesis